MTAPALSPLALRIARVCDPGRARRCSECGAPTRYGEPTCEAPECRASLDAAVRAKGDPVVESDAPLCNECGDVEVSRDGAICAECMVAAGYCPSGHPLDDDDRCVECEAEEADDRAMDLAREEAI
jgi:hypothetical protein